MTSISDRIREVLDRVGWDVPTSIVIKDKALSDLTVRQIRNGLGNTKNVDSKKRYNLKNHHRRMFYRARRRAREKNIYFDLEPEDIVIPDFCPILGHRLEPSNVQGGAYNSPSLDRINPKKGYTKDNIQIISCRANNIKGDATIEEIEKLIRWSRRNGSVLDSS